MTDPNETWSTVVPHEPERLNLADIVINWSDGRRTVGWVEIVDWFPDGSPRSMNIYERSDDGTPAGP